MVSRTLEPFCTKMHRVGGNSSGFAGNRSYRTLVTDTGIQNHGSGGLGYRLRTALS